ncbi:MAG: alpha-ketoacid dehydrogenase subunit beta [Deltaproteobacteria bacterium]|nr:alpha-ketoacid dehydrogenase subunit beta [Deltaproteobacteria bacterium]
MTPETHAPSASEAAAATTTQLARLNLVQAINQALEQELARDANVLLLGEDIGRGGGVFRVTEGLLAKFGPDRVMDTPLAESGGVGLGIGLALAGFRPVVEIQFMGFIYPAVNQLFAHAARYRNRTRGRYPVPMVVRTPYGGGIHPPEHHSESYEAMLANTPGLKVVVPSNPYDAKGLLVAAIRDPDPVVFLEPTRLYRAFRQEVPAASYEVPLGAAKVARSGTDVTVIAWGSMMQEALKAAEAAGLEGISVEVVDLRSIVPMDTATVLTSVARTGRAVVVHEAPRTCGLGAELVAQINEHVLLDLLAPVERVTGFDTVFPGAPLENHYLPSVERVLAAVRRTLEE